LRGPVWVERVAAGSGSNTVNARLVWWYGRKKRRDSGEATRVRTGRIRIKGESQEVMKA
jgi:hypothetical protein